MIRWWSVDRPDGLTAFELDFDAAVEGERLRNWIVKRAGLPLLRLFDAVSVATAPPGGAVRFWEGEGGSACVVCRDQVDATAFLLSFP